MTAVTHPHPLQVAPLDAFGATDIAAAGGKAANLGELLRAGVDVPPGFVVTTDAYAAVADRAGLTALLSDPGVVHEPAALRSALLAADVPDSLRVAIAAAYEGLGTCVPVAVRSSATAEDLPGAAFAGQQDTYLNIVGFEAVVDAVRRCWASLWSDRAVAYRRERHIDPADVRIAVVVQTMVESETAGVMFTADPVSGARDRIIVDAGAGLGEAVVSGLVTPDHYLLDQHGRVLEWTAGRGEVVIRSASGGGVRHEAGPSDEQTGAPAEVQRGKRPGSGPSLAGALLTREQLSDLAAQARHIVRHFGRPQDIEWAFATGRLWIVQARPMTALPPPSVRLNRVQRLQAKVLTEYVPVRPYPMDVTTSIAHGPSKMMQDIAHYYGLDGAFQDFLREEDGVVVQLVPPRLRPTPRILLNPGKLIHRIRHFRPSEWVEDARLGAFLTEIDTLKAQDLATLPWQALLRVPERALAVQDYCRDLRIDYLPGSAVAIARMVLTARLLGRGDLMADLLGGARTRTEDSNRALADLAEQVRADPALLALITESDSTAVLEGVAADDRFADFAAALDAFLREFGGRETASPLLVSPPTLAESPEIVVGMVRSIAEQAGPQAESFSRSATAVQALLRHPLLRGRRRQERIRRWVREAQDGLAFREDTHFYFTAAFPTMRRAILEIGERLRRAGVLDEAMDVFHLRWEEVGQIVAERSIPADQSAHLRSLVKQRATRRAELSAVPLIDAASVYPGTDSGDALVAGAPASSGTAVGVVRVIREAGEFDRLQPGDVLVCPYTNPAWTPLFQRAAAVVVDTGAIGSHAAIVAREYGIPAVMGTGTGTSVLIDGQTVTVDGTRGRVTPAP